MSQGAGTDYIGSRISLISKADIRYEGFLYSVDPKESTVALSQVKLYGTENRPVAHHIPPKDEEYDYIIFRGADIKDLQIVQAPTKPASSLPPDPAIVSQAPPKPVSQGAGYSPFGQSAPPPSVGVTFGNFGPVPPAGSNQPRPAAPAAVGSGSASGPGVIGQRRPATRAAAAPPGMAAPPPTTSMPPSNMGAEAAHYTQPADHEQRQPQAHGQAAQPAPSAAQGGPKVQTATISAAGAKQSAPAGHHHHHQQQQHQCWYHRCH
eukprot:scpid12277/ scgid5387/ Protein LSM14 homolog A; Protein FAM61A; RNA-associated protein 55A